MKRTLSLLAATLLVLSLAHAALATDNIGIYCDEAGAIDCCGTPAPYGVVTLYIVAKNISSVSGLSGWEGAVIFDPPSPIGLSFTTLNGGFNVLSPPNFQVGLPIALPYAPAMPLARISFIYLGPVKVGIGPVTPSSFGPGGWWPDLPPGPGYAVGNDPGELRRLYPSSNTPSGTDFFYWVYFIPCPYFTVGVDVTCNGHSDPGNLLGTGSDATDGFDGALDTPEAPHPPSNYLSAFFAHAEWGLPIGEAFTRDLRSSFELFQDEKIWPLSVVTDLVGEVTITFSPSFAANSEYDIVVEDIATDEFTSVFPALTYSYSSPGVGRKDLLLHVGHHFPVPALTPPTRSVAAGWSMLGLPLVTVSGGGTVGEIILDDVSGYSWLYAYVGTTGYELCNSSRVLQRGQGAWIANIQPFNWDMQGRRDTGVIDIPIANGWNLLGYPLWFTLPLGNVRVVHEGVSYSYADALAANLVSGSVYGWNTAAAQYQTSTDLAAWNGYWVAAYQPDVSLRFDYRYLYDAKALALAKADLMPVSATSDDWRLAVLLTDRTSLTSQVVLGVCPTSTDAFDAAWDLPVPPAPPPGPMLEIAIQHPDWLLETGAGFATDLRASENASQVWRTRLTLPQAGPATLSWDPQALPNGFDLNLYLPDQNRVIVRSMRTQASLEVAVPADGLVVEFRTPDHVTGVPSSDLVALALHCVPNPFNPSTEVRFTLPATGRAEVRLFDARGREVRRLGGGELQAGPQTLQWDGRDATGARAASGTYFARLYLNGGVLGHAVKASLLK